MNKTHALLQSRCAIVAIVAAATSFLGSAVAHEGVHKAPVVRRASAGSDAQRIAKTLDNYASAIEGKDLTRVKPLLVANDEFSFYEGAHGNVGWQSYYDHLAPELAMFEAPKYRLTEIQPFVSGNWAYATFAWSLDVTVLSDKFAGGKHAVSMHGLGTAIFSKTDGTWLIRHLQTAQAPAKRAKSESH